MSTQLYVVICVSGVEWLVRARSLEDARTNWPADAEEIRRIEPLHGDRKRAAYLRAQGQADSDA